MPWSIEKAGLANGIFLVVLMGIICLYTAYLLLRAQQLHGSDIRLTYAKVTNALKKLLISFQVAVTSIGKFQIWRAISLENDQKILLKFSL